MADDFDLDRAAALFEGAYPLTREQAAIVLETARQVSAAVGGLITIEDYLIAVRSLLIMPISDQTRRLVLSA